MARPGHLSILYTAYPLLTISDASAGGAEQMFLAVEGELAAAGHETVVAASRGSQVAGRLLDTGDPVHTPDDYERREQEHSRRLLEHLRGHPSDFDLIHDHSGSFWRFAGECPVPVIATLHLPQSFYKPEWFRALPPNLFFVCVSASQAASFHDLANVPTVVQNGISLDRFDPAWSSRHEPNGTSEYLLWLGRICEEKAPHVAIGAAKAAGVPLVIAGQVYPFSYHQHYFDAAIAPHLDGTTVRLVDSPSLEQKLRLLAHAKALLLTSTAAETSSLVAMEAMACGTPVIAVRSGAFPEIVSHGETGFVVDSWQQIAAVIPRLREISPAACRARVEKHFTSRRMAQDYLALYADVLRSKREAVA